MPYQGSCACGSVTATITGEPVAVRQCWCHQCQKAAAGNATCNAIFRKEDIAVSGDLSTHGYPAASGNRLTHFFCAGCGTQVYAQSSARLHLATVRLGFLDPGHDIRPQAVIWTADAPDWAQFDPALEQFTHQPPPPPGQTP